MRFSSGILCAAVGLICWGGFPSLAQAQSSVRGQAVYDVGEGYSLGHLAVNAWIDRQGVAHGEVNLTGAIPFGSLHRGGPADPWHMSVLDIFFIGNTAYVFAVVDHSLYPEDLGLELFFELIDNQGNGPDMMNGFPLLAGNIIIR